MRIKITGLLAMAFLYGQSFGQTCLYKGLSAKFNYEITYRKTSSTIDGGDSCIVTVNIFNKREKKLSQTIILKQIPNADVFFEGCNSVRSYITGKRQYSRVTDNDYGTFIIADFNFDNKEDIAIKNDVGGNSGPTYSYYIQNKNGQFIQDIFLTDSMQFFPTYFNKKKKVLTTIVFASARDLGETSFKLNTINNIWMQTRHRFLKM